MVEEDAASRFWHYALHLYGDAQIRERLLRWQDSRSVSIPVILYALWQGHDGQIIGQSECAAIHRIDTLWRDNTVERLREHRRNLKKGVDGIPSDLLENARQAIAQAEQMAEKMLMTQLAALDFNRTNVEPATAIQANICALYPCLSADDINELCAHSLIA